MTLFILENHLFIIQIKKKIKLKKVNTFFSYITHNLR